MLTSVRLPPRPACQSSSTMCRREPPAGCPMRQSRGWPRCLRLSASRTLPVTSRGRRACGHSLDRLSGCFRGDDALGLSYFAQGGDGVISVTSNVAPGLYRNMFLAWKQGQVARSHRLALALAQLTAVLFRETNPVPLKYALSLFGLMSPRVRLPLVELSDQAKTEIDSVVARLCDEYSGSIMGTIGGSVRASRLVMAG